MEVLPSLSLRVAAGLLVKEGEGDGLCGTGGGKAAVFNDCFLTLCGEWHLSGFFFPSSFVVQVYKIVCLRLLLFW